MRRLEDYIIIYRNSTVEGKIHMYVCLQCRKVIFCNLNTKWVNIFFSVSLKIILKEIFIEGHCQSIVITSNIVETLFCYSAQSTESLWEGVISVNLLNTKQHLKVAPLIWNNTVKYLICTATYVEGHKLSTCYKRKTIFSKEVHLSIKLHVSLYQERVNNIISAVMHMMYKTMCFYRKISFGYSESFKI